jgi:hypothetical protein
LAKLDLAFLFCAEGSGAAPSPIDRFLLRVDLDQPVAGDPARSSKIPAFAISSLYFVIAAMSLLSGITPASESLLALTNIMNRIVFASFAACVQPHVE